MGTTKPQLLGRSEGDMPHEKINHPQEASENRQLVISWNKIGWVQASIYPERWTNTGDAFHVGLPENELDLLIRTLKKAKRVAYSTNARHDGFSNTARGNTEPLFSEGPSLQE